MINRLSILALVAAAVSAAPASAQYASDVTEDLRVETRDFAQCIAAKDPVKAQKLLGLTIGSPEYRRAMTKLVKWSGCVEDPDMATFEPLLLSGALAELAIKDGVPAGLGSLVASANPADPALAMADCAVRADKAKSEALLATKWLSDDERDAAFDLSATLKPCAAKDSIRITAAQLRGLVALATLRTYGNTP
ncbi:hypothetical protein A6F68_02237 [Tsuneonella dongtanensis]|uniref:Lysozyme inhibitor LprI N-terminal domain-containing protein n=1 Tax=Tsuneonella dongtanensis TaxID=692370 RepID=A0A1B2AF03_9SPHN|nr:hypothetical protein [Tsuneonella dongtanensis]ANY20737.1 hypothetical protein A6F68_02237 [Tsuneonella dongtanensis]